MNRDLVFDTNVMLSDGSAVRKFEGDRINIPFIVLQELDKHKTDPGDVGMNARTVIRFLDELRVIGNLAEGVVLDSVSIRVVMADEEWAELHPDDQIINTARKLQTSSDLPTVIISNDINLRVKASLFDILAEGHNGNKIHIDESRLFTGISHVDVKSNVIDELHAYDQIDFPEASNSFPNSFLHLRSPENNRHTGVARVMSGNEIKRMSPKQEVFGVRSKNLEQACAFDLLLDDSLPLVTLMGVAGTGKTLLSLAAALESVLHRQTHKRVIIMRPPIPMGKDIGFLPGSLYEKMSVWMGPIIDNFELLLESNSKFNFEHLVERGIIDVQPPTFIRGRSIMNSIVLVDEAQGLTQHEMKTIVTRMHESSKLIVTGDVRQIDNPKLSALDNGFSFLVEAFKPYPLSGHVTLTKCERSNLAALAAQVM